MKYDIYHCFNYISENDQRRFVNKFRSQHLDSKQMIHTFMELILGAYLSSKGFEVVYEYRVVSKTPDWCIFDKESAVIGIVELVNFHRDEDTKNEIDRQMQAKGHAIFWLSPDNLPKNIDRLYEGIKEKMVKYLDLAQGLRVPYVVAVYPDWQAGVNFEKLLPCLHNSEDGLFQMYPGVSGVLYSEGNLERCSFRYEQNPNALRSVGLPSGAFSFVKEQVN